MAHKKLVVRRLEGVEPGAILTESGWHYLNPWYKKIWGWFKGDIRSIIVSAITALLVAWLSSLLLRPVP